MISSVPTSLLKDYGLDFVVSYVNLRYSYRVLLESQVVRKKIGPKARSRHPISSDCRPTKLLLKSGDILGAVVEGASFKFTSRRNGPLRGSTRRSAAVVNILLVKVDMLPLKNKSGKHQSQVWDK